MLRFRANSQQWKLWVFPLFMTVVLCILTGLRISGSSVGIYHQFFYGSEADPNLIANQPRSIRSDEWLVNSQMTFAQVNNNLNPRNENIGQGQDMTVLMDVPYREWSVIFRPQNLAFFVLPFENAFAFRWWFASYALVISAYLLVLTILPKRVALSVFLSLALLFSPFIQWWYNSGTLGPIYMALFGVSAAVWLLRAATTRQALSRGILVAYIGSCFALIFYPPFQLPCLLVGLGVLIGMILEEIKLRGWRQVAPRLGVLCLAVALSAVVTLSFFNSRSDTVRAVMGTVYPGERVVASGGYDWRHLFAGHLSAPLQDTEQAKLYSLPQSGITNQSEASNFVLFPLLLLPFILLGQLITMRFWRSTDWPLIACTVLFVILLTRLFVPDTDWIFRPLLLTGVPHTRLLIGFGLLNFFALVFIARVVLLQPKKWAQVTALIVTLLITALLWLGGRELANELPGFFEPNQLLFYTIVVALIIMFFQMSRLVTVSAALLFTLSFLLTFQIHPLYRGASVLGDTELATAIRKNSKLSPQARWVVEGIMLENYAIANGARSLSGVYAYPQHEFWESAGFSGNSEVYNRYAHFNVTIDRETESETPTRIELTQLDSFTVITEPCSRFMQEQAVGFLVTVDKLNPSVKCASLIEEISLPLNSYYIYQFHYGNS